MALVDKLNKAQKIKNDEFYTKYEDIKKMDECLNFSKYLKENGLTAYCPFSKKESNFVKYFQDHNIPVKFFKDNEIQDYKLFNYGIDGVVIDNPPFSILKEIIPFFNKHNINFILLVPLLVITQTYFLKLWNENKINLTNYYNHSLNFGGTENKEVNCHMITNITQFYITKYKTNSKGNYPPWFYFKGEWIELKRGWIDDVPCFNKNYTIQHFYSKGCQRMDKSKYVLTIRNDIKPIFKRYKWERREGVPKYEIIKINEK